jgi:4-carboxymuconolactone decarboxylase
MDTTGAGSPAASELDELRRAGRARRERAQGAKAETLQRIMASFDEGLASFTDGFIFGEVWGRPGLSFEERMLVAISMLMATEHPNQLRNYLHGALQDGIPASKIQEIVVMLTVYCGFPTALEAMMEWQKVLAKAREMGVEIDLDKREPA